MHLRPETRGRCLLLNRAAAKGNPALIVGKMPQRRRQMTGPVLLDRLDRTAEGATSDSSSFYILAVVIPFLSTSVFGMRLRKN